MVGGEVLLKVNYFEVNQTCILAKLTLFVRHSLACLSVKKMVNRNVPLKVNFEVKGACILAKTDPPYRLQRGLCATAQLLVLLCFVFCNTCTMSSKIKNRHVRVSHLLIMFLVVKDYDYRTCHIKLNNNNSCL